MKKAVEIMLILLFINFSNSFADGPTTNNYWEELRSEFASNTDNRLRIDSDWYYIDDSNANLHSTINGWDIINSERVRQRGISKKAFEMIKRANRIIIASVFLFDCMYSDNNPANDVVKEFTDLLIAKKKNNPDLSIIVILDPLNRAYGRRVSPSVKKFIDNGIDVFYSDLLPTASATRIFLPEALNHIGRFFNESFLGGPGAIWDYITSFSLSFLSEFSPVPESFDGQPISLEMIKEAALFKANHRKILVTDTGGEKDYEALVSSANPHNASDDSSNHAISVKGELARYIYMVLREDAIHSVFKNYQRQLNFNKKKPFAMYSKESQNKYPLKPYRESSLRRYLTEQLPAINGINRSRRGGKLKAKFVTEDKIKEAIIDMLNKTGPDDEVRIQMFYLSDYEVVDAIIRAASDENRNISNPIRLILDPNKDAFNKIKDGTPNRQVAHHLLNSSGKSRIQIRWYSTHGEQNHAKIMTITNKNRNKYQITTGSCNWTGKNMNNINMESNLILDGSKRIIEKFNNFFDIAWINEDENIEYTLPYNSYDLMTTYKMVIGFELVKDWEEEVKDQWIKENYDRISRVFLSENPYIVYSYDKSKTIEGWLSNKIEKDKTGVTRVMLTIVGEDESTSEKSNFITWKNGYIKKWHAGENWGFVSW